MTELPAGSKWYWAELIEEIVVEDDPRNVVHRNLALILADSPTKAYENALEIGRQYESDDINPNGKSVKTRFRGLGGLDVIHDDLRNGAEILYVENISVQESQIKEWIRRKEELALFRDDDATNRPDYSSKEIALEVQKILG